MSTPPLVQTQLLDPVPNASNLLNGEQSEIRNNKITRSIIAQIWMQWFVELREKINVINTFLATWAGVNPTSGVTAATYGDTTHYPVFTVNQFGQITAAHNQSTGGGGGTPPLVANFTTFGTGITATDQVARMKVITTSINGQLRGLTQASIATPYTIDMHLAHVGAPSGSDASECGICLSDGTKFIQYTVGDTSGIYTARIISWATSSSGNALVFGNTVAFDPSSVYVRITDSGTTRTYLISANGLDFFTFYSEATNTYLTPTKFGMTVYNNAAGSTSSVSDITNWVITNSVLGDAP